MSKTETNEFESEYMKKQKRERSKAGQEQDKKESTYVNASFSEGSETEREKTSKRLPTGSQV
jgi:hypothetical protein